MFLASLDIKHAFYQVLVCKIDRKFLKFMHKKEALDSNAMPNCYKIGMQLFNEILKPSYAYLREQGLSSVIYVDDTLFGGDEFEECQANVKKTLQ